VTAHCLMVLAAFNEDLLDLLLETLQVQRIDKVKNIADFVRYLAIVELAEVVLEPLLVETQTLNVDSIRVALLSSYILEHSLRDLIGR